MLAHHDVVMAAQAGGYIGLSGVATMVTARWYSLTRRARRDRVELQPNPPTPGETP